MTVARPTRDLAAELSDLGFTPAGRQRFASGDVTLAVSDAWLTLHAPVTSAGDWLRRPGPWKPGARPDEQWCDLPRRACAAGEPEGRPSDLEQAIAWATTARDPDWTPPPTDAATDLTIEPRALTARAGALTCQGELHTDAGRLWIDYRVATLAGEPDPARQRWLTALLRATHRTRMVRVVAAADGGAVHARVDLSGLRSPLRAALVAEALPRLRAVVERLLPAVDLLTDAGFVSRALELGDPRREPRRGETR